jgi:hypothetical protein
MVKEINDIVKSYENWVKMPTLKAVKQIKKLNSPI